MSKQKKSLATKCIVGAAAAFVLSQSNASECIDKKVQISTPQGPLRLQRCSGPRGKLEKWLLGDREVLSGDAPITDKAQNKAGSLVVFSGGAYVHGTGCQGELKLVDFTGATPRVFRFGVKNACNEFHWASWGARTSVIALKENVRFVYAEGVLSPPQKDNALSSSIKPSMFDTPVESLEPFAGEVISR